jgi:hypothetical protein
MNYTESCNFCPQSINEKKVNPNNHILIHIIIIINIPLPLTVDISTHMQKCNPTSGAGIIAEILILMLLILAAEHTSRAPRNKGQVAKYAHRHDVLLLIPVRPFSPRH